MYALKYSCCLIYPCWVCQQPPAPHPPPHTHTLPLLPPHYTQTHTRKQTEVRGIKHKGWVAYCTMHQILNCLLWQIDSAQSVWRDSQCCEEWVKWISPCHIVGTDYCNWEPHLPFTQLCLFFTHACWKGTHSALVRADSEFFCFWVLMLEPRSGLRPLGLRNKRHRVKRRRRRGRRSKTVRNSEE